MEKVYKLKLKVQMMHDINEIPTYVFIVETSYWEPRISLFPNPESSEVHAYYP